MSRPLVVQHSFGEPGTGGPIGALARLLRSDLRDSFDFVELHQPGPLGGVDASLLRDWRRVLREVRPDIVHVRGLGNEGFHGALAARAAGVPRVLVSVHGTHRDLQVPSGPAGLRSLVVRDVLEPATLALATHVATVCEYAAGRRFLARWRAKHVGVVPNGVDLPTPDAGDRLRLRREWAVDDSDVVLVSVGRLSREKGLGDLASALRLVGEREAALAARLRLVVVGEGPDRAALEEAFAGLPGNRPLFLGRRLDVGRILAAADVFVFPSWHENLSNALLEAMAAGLPVVATGVGGNTEVLRDGAGILVPRQSPALLATAVAALAGDAAERGRLGAAARRRVEERYTTERMVAGWGAVYRRMLAGPR